MSNTDTREALAALRVIPVVVCTDGHARGSLDRCKNMRCTYEGMDGERYRCNVCGESYFLDYEEMR